MHLNHPVALQQVTELKAAELHAAAYKRPRSGRRRRLRLRLARRLIIVRAPAS